MARLLTEVRATLADAIAKGGSTLRDYVDSRGEPGYFQLDYARLRAAWATLSQLRRGHTRDPAGGSRHLLLPGLSALTSVRAGTAHCRP